MKFSILTLASGVLVSSSLILSGCGKSADQIAQDARNVVQNESNRASSTSWISDCQVQGLPGIAMTEKEIFDISPQHATKKVIYFSDTKCNDVSFVVQYKGTAQIHDGDPQNKNAKTIDFSFQQVTLTPVTDVTKGLLNTGSICGISNYQTNTETDITSGSGKATCPSKGARSTYNVILINGNHMYLGGDGDQTDANERPSQVDTNKPFTRQG